MSNKIPQYSQLEIGGEPSMSVEWVDFIGTKMVSSSIGQALAFLKWEENYEGVKLDDERTIYQFFGNTFIVEYKDEATRDKDRDMYKKHFRPTKHFAEQEDDGNQVPEPDFKVDYKGKYYLAVTALLELTNEEDTNKWVYKWVIFNPWANFPLHETIGDMTWKVEKIL